QKNNSIQSWPILKKQKRKGQNFFQEEHVKQVESLIRVTISTLLFLKSLRTTPFSTKKFLGRYLLSLHLKQKKKPLNLPTLQSTDLPAQFGRKTRNTPWKLRKNLKQELYG